MILLSIKKYFCAVKVYIPLNIIYEHKSKRKFDNAHTVDMVLVRDTLSQVQILHRSDISYRGCSQCHEI